MGTVGKAPSQGSAEKPDDRTGEPENRSIEIISNNYRSHVLKNDLYFQYDKQLKLGLDYYKTEDLLFFDVECVSLGFGAANTPFLLGLAWFHNNRLHTEQLFSHSPVEEPESLQMLDSIWRRFRYIVTYNGKSFDVPLIKSRFALFKKQYSDHFIDHFDLYHIMRKVYPLPRYRLIDAENHLINLIRDHDLPGKYAPQAYFEYVKFAARENIERVLEHNLADIQSLAALSLKLDRVCKNENDRQARIYRFTAAHKHPQFTQRIIENLQHKTAEDLFNLSKALKKQKKYREAAIKASMAYKKGHSKALSELITLLYYYLKRYGLALKVIEAKLPLETADMQEKLLVQRKKIEDILTRKKFSTTVNNM